MFTDLKRLICSIVPGGRIDALVQVEKQRYGFSAGSYSFGKRRHAGRMKGSPPTALMRTNTLVSPRIWLTTSGPSNVSVRVGSWLQCRQRRWQWCDGAKAT